MGTEDTSIADPTAQRVDIATDLELEVSHLSFTDGNKKDMTALIGTPTAVTNTAGGTLGNAGLTYTALATNGAVALGDYMELKVKDTGTKNIFTTYSVSLEKCWASNAALPATIDNTNPTAIKYYQDTSTGAVDEFVFWDDFCSKYPDWVGPNTAANYLGETTDHAHSIHAVHFRQFGFLSQQAGYAAGTGVMYFHCYVKVCPIADEATCSKTLLDGTTNTNCAATAMLAPARKRRQANESGVADAYDLAAPAVTSQMVSDAECIEYDRERKVCLKVVEKKSSGATTTCAASTMLTVLTAGLLR